MAACQDRRGRYSDAYAQAPPLFGPRKDLAGVASGLLKVARSSSVAFSYLTHAVDQTRDIISLPRRRGIAVCGEDARSFENPGAVHREFGAQCLGGCRKPFRRLPGV